MSNYTVGPTNAAAIGPEMLGDSNRLVSVLGEPACGGIRNSEGNMEFSGGIRNSEGNMGGDLEGMQRFFYHSCPKKTDPVGLNEYHPISLIGSFYKVIAKLLSNRLKKVIPNLVGFKQSAFIKGRNILDGALIANETLSFLKHKRIKSVIFKVDFEKAFDCLSWDFLIEIMEIMGFGYKWRKWIMACLKSASISVLVNGSLTSEFNLERGYADDTIFFGSWSEGNIRNLMKLLKCFELTSGLKVNFHKSNLIGIGVDKIQVENMARLFRCKVGSTTFIYLGLPVGGNMKKEENWKPVLNKFEKRLSDWRARSILFGGRLTLVKSVLNSLPLYYFSLFRAPPCVIKELECGIINTGANIEETGLAFRNFFVKEIGDGASTSFWNDDWIGNEKLKNKFKRLSRLEPNLDVTIQDRLSWDGASCEGKWAWTREPSGRANDELQRLNDMISIVKFNPQARDRWKWKAGGGEHFTTKELTNLINSRVLITNISLHETLSNKLVPKKIEVFVWRARKKRIPVLVELDKRGIDLDSVRYPLCDDDIKTVDHSMIGCKHALEVWSKVFDWWGRGGVPYVNVEDLFLDSGQATSFVGKLLWQADLSSNVCV
ncbi:uncharacterized protein [Rutidosis leptorrhynchoides]|uniref:uncharacterized protein n=1 Tax=Rutidosis leptorrhynchoides TaxID=125765 RepID=UPI003A9928C0